MLLPEGAIQTALGSQHSLILTESHSVWAMGQNSSGQLGLGYKSSHEPLPRRIHYLAGIMK